jgi:hypothetical protein
VKRRHLILVLNGNSWGRTLLARTLAEELSGMGDEVVLFANDANAAAFSGANCKCVTMGDHMQGLAPLYLEQVVAEVRPHAVVLCDYFSNANFMAKMGADSAVLNFENAVTFTLDLWNFEQTGYTQDLFQGEQGQLGPGDEQEYSKRFKAIPYKLKPVPLIAPASTAGVFSSLPSAEKCATAARRAQRALLGLKESSKLVLFCTSSFQHVQYSSAAGTLLAASVPSLLADYVARLGKDVHLVHVGPQAYDVKEGLNGRYHWLPSVPPDRFAELLAGVDVFLSANISSTTIATAMVCQLPTVVVQNSISAANREQAETAMGRPASAWLGRWLDSSLPIFPFALWPLGCHRFLAPLLRANPYTNALEIVELLDEQQVEASLSAVLFDECARSEHLHRQAAYVSQVAALPTAAQIVKNMVGD